MTYNQKQKALHIAFSIGAFFVCVQATHASANSIVFTEIMYNPSGSDSKKEWVEIYNNGTENVEIVEGSGANSWRFNDGSNHTITLFQGDLIIPASTYAILASDAQTFLDDHPDYNGTIFDTVMALNNTTDTIKLSSDKGETFFSETIYNDTLGADGDGNSLQLLDNTWSGASETPGKATTQQETSQTPDENPPVQESENQEPATNAPQEPGTPTNNSSGYITQIAYPKNVKITEIFPNPIGDEQQEFIEIWNNNPASISLEGWKISDNAKIKTLSDIILIPGEYYTLYRSNTGIALNNSNEVINLYSSDGTLIDTHEYTSTIEGYSLSFDLPKNSFTWSSTKTPSKANQITIPNDPPNAVIEFSNNPVAPTERFTITGLNSTDPDDDKLSFLWKIGTSFQAYGPTLTYKFNNLGAHTVTLEVSDTYHNIVATSVMNVIPAIDIISQRISLTKFQTQHTINNPSSTSTTTGQIYITEIFPNPSGRDDTEWIELYNPNDFDIILDDWIIDDEEGGSRPYTINNRTINAKKYLVLGKEETKITLNNSSDEVRLFDLNNNLIDEVLYDDVVENQSYISSDDVSGYWTSNITPGEPTMHKIIPATYEFVPPLLTTSRQLPSNIVDIDLPNIRELELGTEVRVQGVVAVEPGVLGKTYFYITGSPGIQVYFSKKDWPTLAVGDVVGIIGELSETNNELRLKIASKNDIVPLYVDSPPIPTELATGEIGESMEGSLIKLTAQLVQKKGTSWYIDDGTGEVKITFQPPANLKKPNIKTGEWLSVVGLVSETRSGYRVLPRYQEDIRLIDLNDVIVTDNGKVLGAYSASDDIQRFRIPENNRNQKLLTYLIITSLGLIVCLSGLLVKHRIDLNRLKNEKQ